MLVLDWVGPFVDVFEPVFLSHTKGRGPFFEAAAQNAGTNKPRVAQCEVVMSFF